MKENTAEVIDFEEVVQAKSAGSGGGYDHFTGMAIGTRFAVVANGWSDSSCDEYVLMSKQGPTVLLQNESPRPDYNPLERHIGSKFWKLNTLVQILHVPDKDNNNGNSVEN